MGSEMCIRDRSSEASRALLATHVRMIHELDMVDQPHEAEDGHETKVLEGANGRVKT